MPRETIDQTDGRTSAATPRPHDGGDNSFDLLRLLAATGVLVSHSYSLWNHIPDPLQKFLWGRYTLGDFCVYVFFIISGYLVTQSWVSDPHPSRYLVRRAVRILPALHVNLLLSVFVLGPVFTAATLSDYFSARETWDYLQGILVFPLKGGLPRMFETSVYPMLVNAPLWSLRIETLCYVLVPLLALFGLLGGRWRTTLVAVALAVLVEAQNMQWQPGLQVAVLWMEPTSMVGCTAYFFAGSALYFWRDRISWSGRAVALFFVIMALAATFAPSPPARMVPDPFLHALLPYCTLYFARLPTRRFLPAAKFGDLSYGIYIYAWPMQQIVATLAAGRLSLPAYIGLSMAATLVSALLSWHLVEKWALRLKPGRRQSLAH